MPPIVLLHLSDLHFGPNSRFAGIEPKKLGERFHRELVEAKTKLKIDSKIDLVAVTGDVAEAGKRSEFEAGRAFLTELASLLDLATDRFLFVPGNHDINWASCKRVEAELEEAEELNEENLRCRIDEVKLDLYFEFLKKFYGVDDLDAISEPLIRGARLYRFPDLRVAVAALDSCERESHRQGDHFGEIGEEQAAAVMAALRKDDVAPWIKIGLVHHNPDLTTPNNREAWRKSLLKKRLFDADLLARFVSDAFGLVGSERLKHVTEDARVQVLLHGHQHARDKKTWDWRSNGRTHVISAGSLALNTGKLPQDEPASARLIGLYPEAYKIRIHSLVYLVWSRAEGSTEQGGFAVDPEINEQGLDLPGGYLGIGPRLAQGAVTNTWHLKSYRDRLRDVYTRWDVGSLGALRPTGAHGEDAPLGEMYVEIRFRRERAPEQPAEPLRPEALPRLRRHTVLRGTGGSGKTTWARYTFTKLIEDDRLLPMMLVVRDVARQWQQSGYDNEKKSIDQALEAWIASHGWTGRLQPFLKAETGPRPILLLDGWDELGPLGSDLRGKLLGFLREHPRVLAVVTSRPYGTGRPSHDDGFEVLDLEPLGPEAIEALTRRFFDRYPSSVLGGRRSANAFLHALRQSPEAQEIVKTPLLLTMMLLVGQAEPLPEKRHILYEKCVGALLHVRPEQKEKEGALRESHIWCPSDLDTRRRWVAELAFCVQSEGYKSKSRAPIVRSRSEMRSFLAECPPEEKDRFLSWLVETAGLLVDRADGTLAFSHLSFQEYLTATHLETNAKDAEGRLENFRRGIGDTTWWETLRLLAAQIWGRNPKFLDTVVESLLENFDAGSLALAGVVFADGLGSESLFEIWLSLWRRELAEKGSRWAEACGDVWNISRTGERKERVSSEISAEGVSASWPVWLRLEAFGARWTKLDLPKSTVARALLDLREGQVLSEPRIAAGRIFAGAFPIWPDPVVGLLHIWPGRRRLTALRIQLAVAVGIPRSQLSRLAMVLSRFEIEPLKRAWASDCASGWASTWALNLAVSLKTYMTHDLARYWASELARDWARDCSSDWPRDWARILECYWASDFARDLARYWASDWPREVERYWANESARMGLSGTPRNWPQDLADHWRLAWAHDWVPNVSRYWPPDSLRGHDLAPYWARQLGAAPEAVSVLDFATRETLSAGRSGARVWIARLPLDTDADPRVKYLAEACRRSLTEDHKSPLSIPDDGSEPLWPALARHVARRSTPEDRALLEDLARHPEKREPPLQWGLRFIVRGDVMLDDGSFVTLDELAKEGGYTEPIPYLEEMEPELEVDFDA